MSIKLKRRNRLAAAGHDFRCAVSKVVPRIDQLAGKSNYSQTSVFEHNSFWKAVQKSICSKTESYFPITNNVKEINLFHVPKEQLICLLTLYSVYNSIKPFSQRVNKTQQCK